MSPEIIGGLARHILTVAAGIFVARGTIDASMAEQAVGAVAALLGVGWSIWTKRAK